MVSIFSLWLPVLLSAVLVFIVSSLIHSVLGYHNTNYGKVPDEDKFMDAVRPLNIPAGDYVVPACSSSKERKEPAFKEKLSKGPVLFMTVIQSGEFKMGGSLIQWFIYCVVVGIFAAYVAGHALPTGTNYLLVFRIAGSTAFAGYALALLQHSIWYKRSWKTTFKLVFDGLIYALLTAGVFGWLWPKI